MRPYEDVRVIDMARELGSYGARLFADLGAEVIRIEELSAGQPVASDAARIFLHTSKKTMRVDYGNEQGRTILRELIASAQIVFYEVDERRDDILPFILGVPGQRIVSVVSYFGLTGPYRDYVGCDLVAQAAGGIAWLTGDPAKEPLRLAGEQSCFVTSVYAATATAFALWELEESGQGCVIDVSAQESIAHSLQNAPQVYDLERRVPRRGGEGMRDATENIFACKDGFIFLAAPLQLTATWSALVQWVTGTGHPGSERLHDPKWKDRRSRMTAEYHAEFRLILESFASDKTKTELMAAALERRIVLAPVNTIADTLADPQLMYRAFFQRIPYPALGRDLVFPGPPYKLSELVWSIALPATEPG